MTAAPGQVLSEGEKSLPSDVAARYFNQEAILKLLDGHKGGENHMQPIWSIYSFLLWYDEFFVRR